MPAIATIAIFLIFASSAFAQAVAYNNAVYTTSGQVPPGALTPVLAVPGSTIAVCQDSACASRATTYTTASAGTPCPTLAQLIPATGSGTCTSLADGQGNFFFYALPGQYWYRITLPAAAGGGSYIYPISIGASAGCPLGVVCDASYGTLAAAFTAAGSGTLYITRAWNGQTNATYTAIPLFYGKNAVIQVASGNTVTIPCPTVTGGAVQVFDTHLGGHVAIPASCPAFPQWWGVKADDSTDNHTAFNEALAYATILNVPGGIYRSSAYLNMVLNNQQLLCGGSYSSILKFTGNTHGILIGNGSPLIGNVVDSCQLLFVGTADSGIVVDYNSGDLKSRFRITNNYITTCEAAPQAGCSGAAGTLITGIRIVAGESGEVSNNGIYGEITNGEACGTQSSEATDQIEWRNNIVGALITAGNGSAFSGQFCQASSIIDDYYQGAFQTDIVSLDAASGVTVTGLHCDNPDVEATSCINSAGTLVATGLEATGKYTNVVNSPSGTTQLYGTTINAAASGHLIVLHSTTPGSSVSGCVQMTNSHATGGGIDISVSPSVTVSGCSVTTVGGNDFDIDSALSASITGGTLTTTSGDNFKFLHSSSNNLVAVTGVVAVNGTGPAKFCVTCYNGSSGELQGSMNTVNGAIIPDSLVGGVVASATTITPPGSLFSVTGTTTIQTINFPYTGYTGCIRISPSDGSVTFGTSGNIYVGATVARYGLATLCANEYASAWSIQ